MALISLLKLNIAERLQRDKNFRERFFRGQAQDEIAISIRSLREKKKMRQVDLARKSKMKQSAISRIEQADYSSWSFNTLLRVANALDARLRISLEATEIVIDRYKEKEVTPAIGSKIYWEVSTSGTSEIVTGYLLIPGSIFEQLTIYPGVATA